MPPDFIGDFPASTSDSVTTGAGPTCAGVNPSEKIPLVKPPKIFKINFKNFKNLRGGELWLILLRFFFLLTFQR